MINFKFIGNVGPEDDEISNIYAIYGCDSENHPHFLVIGGAVDTEQVPVIDISALDHEAQMFNEEDSAIEVAESFGIISNIKFFYQAEDFELELDF